jgi:hypothetical protein
MLAGKRKAKLMESYGKYAKVLLVAACIASGCATSPQVAGAKSGHAARPARINHVVLGKLHNPAEADELIHDCDTMLAPIAGVTSYFCGKHLDTARLNVDANYDVGLYLGFMTEEAYDGYVNHPDHIALVEKWKPRLQWLRIHDVIDDTP